MVPARPLPCCCCRRCCCRRCRSPSGRGRSQPCRFADPCTGHAWNPTHECALWVCLAARLCKEEGAAGARWEAAATAGRGGAGRRVEPTLEGSLRWACASLAGSPLRVVGGQRYGYDTGFACKEGHQVRAESAWSGVVEQHSSAPPLRSPLTKVSFCAPRSLLDAAGGAQRNTRRASARRLLPRPALRDV